MSNLRRLAGECDDGKCPTVFASDRDTFVFQGPMVVAGVQPSAGEQAVELSIQLVEEALATWKAGERDKA